MSFHILSLTFFACFFPQTIFIFLFWIVTGHSLPCIVNLNFICFVMAFHTLQSFDFPIFEYFRIEIGHSLPCVVNLNFICSITAFHTLQISF